MTRRRLPAIALGLLVAVAVAIAAYVVLRSPSSPSPPPAPSPAPGGGETGGGETGGGGHAGPLRTVVSPRSFWYRPLPADAAIDRAETSAAAADLTAEAAKSSGSYINTTSYSSPITIVTPRTPRVPVRLSQPSWNGVVPTYDRSLAAVLAQGVPIPSDWKEAPASDSDAEGVFYCPACRSRDGVRGVLWELWRLRRDPAGHLTASFGGRMAHTRTNPGYWVDRTNGARYPDLPSDPVAASTFESRLWGATATSLPLAAGEITAEDVRRGRIDHALGFAALPASIAKGYRWPAQRGDGYVTSGAPLQEGMRLRLPAGTRCSAMAQRVGRMVCEAATRYGIVLWDRSGALSFRAEPAVVPAFRGVAPSQVLAGFPWERLQVLATGSAADPNPR